MGQTVQQFVKSLTESGVLAQDEVANLLDTISQEGVPVEGNADSQALAAELLRQQKITEYQVQHLDDRDQGLTLGSYLVLDEIGSGGMGRVFKAEHRRMKRIVAIKVLSSAMQSPKSIKRFQREVEAAAKLNHPNIVAAYDADEEHGVHYLVMEYVDGSSLAEHVLQQQISSATAVNYVLQAAYALRYAHQQGIVHRDIKPGNLLLSADGVVKVLDMGLARFDEAPGAVQSSDRPKLTQAGQIMGTVDFMSPEQAEDTRQADARSDIYSLGCTLFYLLTGEPPYDGDTVMRKLLAHREHALPSITAKRAEVGRQLDAIFQRMVAKRPEDRYQSMGEVILALEAYASAPTDGPASSMLKHAFGSGILSRNPRPGVKDEPAAAPDDGSVLGGEPAFEEEELTLKEDADRAAPAAPPQPQPSAKGALIKVTCSCGQRFAVKAEHAGKRVRCRHCGEAVAVPADVKPDSTASLIAVECKQCGKRLSVGRKLAGKTVKCSQCAAPIKIPNSSGSDSTVTTKAIRIACRCGKQLNVGAHLAGKTVKCPACAAPVKVPKELRA